MLFAIILATFALTAAALAMTLTAAAFWCGVKLVERYL